MSNLALSLVRPYALILFLGLWAFIGSGDWVRQKVARRSLLWGLAGAGLGYLVLVSDTLLGLAGKSHQYLLWQFYYAALLHLAVCAAAALAFWMLRIWPAGDAKLFICLALLYPLLDYSGSFTQGKLVLIILINTFMPPALYLFLRAAYYIFDTRLRHGRDFLLQLGWKRELLFFWEKSRDAALGWCASVYAWAGGLARTPGAAAAGLKAAGPLLLQWLTGMASMALVSYYLQDWIHSPMSLSLLCMGLFMLWNQLSRPLGSLAARVLMGSAAALLVYFTPHMDWGRLWRLFSNISVFSFFMFLGMNWAMKMMAGGWTILAQVLLPLLMMAVGYVVSRLWAFIATFFREAAAFLGGLGAPRLPGMGVAGPLLHGGASAVGNAVSGVYPFAGVLLPLAFMGAFFGLSLALVRKWDEEVRPRSHRDTLAPFSILAPEFIEMMKLDPDFFEEHFQSLYADGITREQADALKVWCREQDIEMVPLTPTISFASWIFLGFLLSSLLGGRHVLEALL